MSGAHDPVSLALDALVARFGRLLRQVGRRRGLSDAEIDDLSQEVRIRIWHALATGERIAEIPASYVYRAALTAAVDIIRRRRASREAPLVEQRDSGERVFSGAVVAPAPQATLEEEELAKRVASVVDQLAEPRDVVVRLYLGGYNHTEIAELLGWTEGKTRNLLYRGLGDLREKLSALGIGPVSIP